MDAGVCKRDAEKTEGRLGSGGLRICKIPVGFWLLFRRSSFHHILGPLSTFLFTPVDLQFNTSRIRGLVPCRD